MDSFKLQIITPQKKYSEMDVNVLSLSTHFGQISIYAHHIDFIANVEISPMMIKIGEHVFHFAVSSGVLNVIQKTNTVQLIVRSIEAYDAIDLQRAIAEKIEAEKLLINAKTVREYNDAEIKLKRALNRIKVKNGEKNW